MKMFSLVLHDVELGHQYNRDAIYASADIVIAEDGPFARVVAIAGNTVRTVAVFKRNTDGKTMRCVDIIRGE